MLCTLGLMFKVLNFVLVFNTLLASSCTLGSNQKKKSQFIDKNEEAKPMEKIRFDIQKFQSRKVQGTTEFKEDDGTFVQQFEVGSKEDVNYIEYRTPPAPAPFIEFKRFYKTGVLQMKGQKFHSGLEVGVWKKYNEQGVLIEKIDHEKKYHLSFEKFLSIVKSYQKDKNVSDVNILDKRTSINRQETGSGNIWSFSWEEIPGKIRLLKFSDKTGELLEEMHYNLEDN